MRLWENANSVPSGLASALLVFLALAVFLAPAANAQCANSPPRPIDTLPAGVVNYWSFDKNSTINYGNNTAVPNSTSPTLVCGQVAGAYNFNGVNQSFDINRTIQDNMTILYLTKTSMTGGTGTDYWQDTGIVDGEYNGGVLDFGAVLQGNHYAWGTNDGMTTSGTKVINDNVFHCFAGTRVMNTGNMSIYTDGTMDASRVTSATSSLTQPPNLRIGGTRTGNTTYNPKPWFNGTIDEVVLMNRAITSAEALQFCQFAQSGFTYFATRPNLTFSGTTLVGSAGFTDPDGNPINYSYSLYLNGTRVFTGNSTSLNNVPGVWTTLANYTNISTGNWTFEVWATDGSATSNKINSTSLAITVPVFNLSAFTSVDPQGGNTSAFPGAQVYFFANATMPPNNTSLSGALCTIKYGDNTTASMIYNNTSWLFYQNRSYASPGNYTYNVTCAYGLTAKYAAGSVLVASPGAGCANSPPRPIDTYPAGLLSYWNFDTSANATYGASDGSVVGNLSGVCSKVGGAYKFDSASSSFINTTLLQNGVTQYTIAALVDTQSAQGVIVNDRGSGAGISLTLAIGPSCAVGYGGYCPSSGAGVPSLGVDSNSIWIGKNGIASVADGAWHSLVGVFNSTSGQSVTPSSLNLYVDGLLAAGSTGNIGAVTSPLTGLSGTRIGYHEPWAQYFNGTIDEVAIFDRAVSAAEISQFYNFTQSNFSYFATRPNITFNGSALLGSAAFVDPENDLLNYSYSWYLNGTRVFTGNSTTINSPSGAWENLSAYLNYSTGNWTFEVWATDGKAWSSPINSTPLALAGAGNLFVSTSKQSYNTCGTVFYGLNTTDINDTAIDTQATVSIIDSISSVVYSDIFTSGNAGTGVYLGEYNISQSDLSGTWSIKASTCGNAISKLFTVN